MKSLKTDNKELDDCDGCGAYPDYWSNIMEVLQAGFGLDPADFEEALEVVKYIVIERHNLKNKINGLKDKARTLEATINNSIYPVEGLVRIGDRIGVKEGYIIIKDNITTDGEK